MRNAIRSAILVLSTLAASPATADVDSLFTVGVGAQFGYVTPGVARIDGAPERQFGLMTRLKFLRFLGIEGVAQLDQDPGTQDERIMSPRLQLGALINAVPTKHFNLFVAFGLGAHDAGDLFDPQGDTTSLHVGPGLEVFLNDHLAVGAGVRVRAPGPGWIRGQVEENIADRSNEDVTILTIWETNLALTVYL